LDCRIWCKEKKGHDGDAPYQARFTFIPMYRAMVDCMSYMISFFFLQISIIHHIVQTTFPSAHRIVLPTQGLSRHRLWEPCRRTIPKPNQCWMTDGHDRYGRLSPLADFSMSDSPYTALTDGITSRYIVPKLPFWGIGTFDCKSVY
jgi:hypothetical protein